MGIEFERSFKVDTIKPFIDYCEKNNFILESEVQQNRIVFEHKFDSKKIARLTSEICNGEKIILLDYKDVGKRQGDLKISIETEPEIIDEQYISNTLIRLENEGYKEAANNLRTRYVYVKGEIKFEIDDYIRPKAQVVAIEGDNNLVEKTYNDIKNLIDEFRVK